MIYNDVIIEKITTIYLIEIIIQYIDTADLLVLYIFDVQM